MTTKNKKTIKRIIEESDKKNIESYMNYFTDDIRWEIVGMPVITGKKEFLIAMETLKLENFPTTNVKNIIAEGEFVVVESTGKDISNSFCDIYRFRDEKIQELTTYIIDTSLIE